MMRRGTADGLRDLGWNCSENALIFSLALTDCGKPCHIAEGGVFIRLPLVGENVTRHWFVVSDSTPPLVYDSSITFKDVCGVFPDCITQPVPIHFTLGEVPANFLDYPRDQGIWYFQNAIHNPRNYITKISKTPYGDWLTSININHGNFWMNAAQITSAILVGRITPPATFSDKQTLVQKTATADYLQEWAHSPAP
jgi:hypothetical protein